MKDWLSRRPELERKRSEAQFNRDNELVSQIDAEIMAILTFENYLRSIEVFGEMALDKLKENNYE